MRNKKQIVLLAAILMLAFMPMAIRPVEAINRVWIVWDVADEASTMDVGTHYWNSVRRHWMALGQPFELTHYTRKAYTSGVYGWRFKIYTKEDYTNHFAFHVYSVALKNTPSAPYTALYSNDCYYATNGIATIYINAPVNGQYIATHFYGSSSIYIDHVVIEAYVNEYLPW